MQKQVRNKLVEESKEEINVNPYGDDKPLIDMEPQRPNSSAGLTRQSKSAAQLKTQHTLKLQESKESIK